MVDEVVYLLIAPGVVPDIKHLDRLFETLVRADSMPRIIVDLSCLDLIASLLLARLLTLQKRVQATAGRLVLCGMHQVVREAFSYSKLDTLFEISSDREAAFARV